MIGEFPHMSSYRPYLLRALLEWISDNDMTPHILVDATQPGTQVPQHAVREGKIVLNIAERAIVGLVIDNEWVSFTARFGGVSQSVHVPIKAILAVYSRETGQGMVLPDDALADGPEPPTDQPPAGPSGDNDKSSEASVKRPHLRVVK